MYTSLKKCNILNNTSKLFENKHHIQITKLFSSNSNSSNRGYKQNNNNNNSFKFNNNNYRNNNNNNSNNNSQYHHHHHNNNNHNNNIGFRNNNNKFGSFTNNRNNGLMNKEGITNVMDSTLVLMEKNIKKYRLMVKSNQISNSSLESCLKLVEQLKKEVSELELSTSFRINKLKILDSRVEELKEKISKLDREKDHAEIRSLTILLSKSYQSRNSNKNHFAKLQSLQTNLQELEEIAEELKKKDVTNNDDGSALVDSESIQELISNFKQIIDDVDHLKVDQVQVTPEEESVPLRYRFYPNSEPYTLAVSKDPYKVDKEKYQKLDYNQNNLQLVKKYNFDKIPKLQHGLERVITQRGLHLINDSSGKPAFSPFLSNIHEFDEVNLNSTYMIPSSDERLIETTLENDCTYFSSTSSITSVLTSIYLLLTKNKSPPSSMYSHSLVRFTGDFIASVTKPISIHLIPIKDKLWSIDNNQGNAEKSNIILMNLGHSMEKMLTLPEDEFNKNILKKNNPNEPVQYPDSYVYSKFDKLLYRSQIDCISDNLPEGRNTFDLKTRATNAIRMNVSETSNFISHHIDRLFNYEYSFEREYLDLSKSGGIKYALQAKLGQMAGIFICYHNTRKIFGSEYIDLLELERSVFWTNHMADTTFRISNQLLQNILDYIVKDVPRTHTYRLLFSNNNHYKMQIFVETLVVNDYEHLEFTYRDTKELRVQEAKQISNPVKLYEVKIINLLNDYRVFSPLHFSPKDNLDVYYSIEEVKRSTIKEEYADQLRQSKLYSQFSF